MNKFLNYSIWGNSFTDYTIALGIFIGGIILVFLFKKYILSRLKSWASATSTSIDDMLVKAMEKSIIPVFYFGILYISLRSLQLTNEFKEGLKITAIIVITVIIVKTFISAINIFLLIYFKKTDTTSRSEKQLKGIRGIVNLLIWSIALIFVLDNLGIKISAVVAGLGIGGIAVALAAQTVLGDLFSYFVIFFDKPFEIGDFIIVGDKIGSVEYIGIKTTRIRAISGEQLVFSNTDLTNSRIHNYKKMERRRVVFNLGVVYQTPYSSLRKIPEIVESIIKTQKDVVFDRGHFANYGDFSLNYEFVYFINGADYNQYMDIQQAINLEIFKKFNEEGIEFAYPSQTLFLNKANAEMEAAK